MITGALVAEKKDTELVKLARRGDKDAFGVLAQRYQNITRRFALRLIGNEDIVQDLVQEAMLQAYLSLKNLRDPTKFRSWLYGILLNICRNHLREKHVAFFSLEAIIQGLHYYPAPLYETPPTPEQLAEEQERYQIVFDAVNALPAADRDAILLFYYAQLSLLEIVNILNVSITTIKVRLHRARRRLKAILQEQHPEIVPVEKRRKIMVKVTIADVIKVVPKEGQEPLYERYVVVLYDEKGRRLVPIWVGPAEGEAIARELNDLAFFRPLTHSFFSSLLQGINARLEEVSVVALKKDTFYAVIKVRNGKKACEIDARPSDAIALAVLNDVPIFVAEEVLETAGIKIPKTIKGSPNRKGLDKITKELKEWQRQYQARSAKIMKQYHERTPEEIAKANEEAIAALFSK
jgi:RNA polymerase sigma factor (sigma-70 family)